MKSPLLRLIAGQIFLHACMTGMRMATPLLALRDGYSAWSVGVLLSLFALTQVFMAIPAGRYTDRHGLKKPMRISIAIAFVGAGLVFAGVTDWCGMAMLLAKLPWNQRSGTQCVGNSCSI